MMKNKKRKSYVEYVLEVIEEVCREEKHPNKQAYAVAVAKRKTEQECQGQGEYTAEDVRSNVSRAIDKLCKEDNPPLIEYMNRYYSPNHTKYLFEKMSVECYEYLRPRVIVEEKEVALISYNMCAFWVAKNAEFGKGDETENEKTVQMYIAECIGEYCYAVFGEGNFVQLMVKCTNELGVVPNKDSNEFAVIRAIEEALVRLYKDQHRIKLKKREVKCDSQVKEDVSDSEAKKDGC